MSVSTKFILRKQSNPNGLTFPIMMRITINRKDQLVSTKKYSSIEDWDDKEQRVNKSHDTNKSINLLLKTISSEVDLFVLSAGRNNAPMSFEDIKALVRKYTGGAVQPKAGKLLSYFDQQIELLKTQNRLGYAATFQSTKNSLSNFTKEKDFDFTSLGLEFILKYEAHLLERKCAATTRSVYFRTFRTLWKNAMKDKICPPEHYPFKDFNFSKYNNPRTKKRAITKEQIDKIAELKLTIEQDTLINSRNYFLFSFYCRGLNFTDLASLKWENIKDGELNYFRAKTKEEFRFQLHPQAIVILDYYQSLEGNSDAGYIFPILYKRHHSEQSIRDRKLKVIKRVNKDLKELAGLAGVEKNITTYVARHSYATVLRRNRVSKEIIGQSLGHDNTKTTDIYLDDIGDPVMDDLINSII
jgi:integrase